MAFIAPLALAAGIAGAGVSAVGAVEQGQATSNAAAYSAQVAANNATIANQNAEYATAAGVQQAADTSLKGAAKSGKIKAGQAASGIDVNTGSAVAVQEGQRETDKLDAETVLNNAELKAYGYRSAATGFTAQSGLDTAESEQAPIGADIGAGGSLLSNASSLGFKWSTAGPASSAGSGVNFAPDDL
jgi:hypothetical protein